MLDVILEAKNSSATANFAEGAGEALSVTQKWIVLNHTGFHNVFTVVDRHKRHIAKLLRSTDDHCDKNVRVTQNFS